MAGEIIAVGEDGAGWQSGDRVCANFAIDHITGVITNEVRASRLGAAIDGVLTEYIILPAHVRILESAPVPVWELS